MTENFLGEQKIEGQKIIYIKDHRPDWTNESTKELLKLYDEKIDLLDTGIVSTQKKVWELVSKEMVKKQFFFSPAQCDNKWKTLKRYYMARQNYKYGTGTGKRHCPFESEIGEILSKRPAEAISNRSNPGDNTFKPIKSDQSDDDIFNINLNNPPGFDGGNEDTSPLDSTDAYVLQDPGQLVEELSQLRHIITKSCRFQAQILKQSTELQQKIVRHLDFAAQRESNALKLKQARIEQQNEIIKQMRAQNSLLQKLFDKMGSSEHKD